MTQLVLEHVVVKNHPCSRIDPDSWAWIFSGCWVIGSQAAVEMLAALSLAVLVATMVKAAPSSGLVAVRAKGWLA